MIKIVTPDQYSGAQRGIQEIDRKKSLKTDMKWYITNCCSGEQCDPCPLVLTW